MSTENSVFEKAIALVLKHEGGYVDNPHDNGGPTNRGITLNTYKNWLILNKCYGVVSHETLVNSLKNLSEEDAKKIYHDLFWLPSKAESIKCEKLATKYFDFSVNASPYRAVKALQDACNSLTMTLKLRADGVIGPLTLSVVNSMDCEKILESFKAQMKAFYKAIVANNPSQKIFLKGWMNRVDSE